ncbi:MAG: hypothetical protein KAJ23_16650 [Maribacter sp.]|nr:hypothetical protein [Maribacter sp.]
MHRSTLSRRGFIRKSSALAIGMSTITPSMAAHFQGKGSAGWESANLASIKINQVNSNFEREPLGRPFGFKGGAMTNVWQTVACVRSESGIKKIGLGTQNVLWSDSKVFSNHSEQGGNALMYAMSERALQMIKGTSFTSPIEVLDDILPDILYYGKQITNNPDLRTTFALNALVGVDNALWLLYAAENGITNFDDMIPEAYRPGLSARHDKVASIPALGYGTSMDEIKGLADDGHFIMKIKIGAPGNQKQMLERDKEFLSNIHKTIGHYETPHSKNGKIPYYFDANGRYGRKETLLRFIDHAEKIGALEQISVLEEPFGEHNEEDVRDITARDIFVAADESAHTDKDALIRIEQGYNTIALKAIAKTLSMTMKIAQLAHEKKIPCFCADLTVNPILVDWNKSIAARLPALSGMNLGLQETNGWQNYRDWDRMMGYHPAQNASWTKTVDGVYQTGKDFYEKSGGIFMQSPHYEKMFEAN